MAVDVNATRRQRAWDSISDGASRTWTRQFRGSTYSLTLSSPQIRALHGGLVFTVDVLATKDGEPIYEDRLNSPNPPMGVVGTDGKVTDGPRQAFRQHVVDVVRAATADFTKPHLMRGQDGNFLGDTLAVRSSTADGRVESDASTSWSTIRAGNSLAASTSETKYNVSASDNSGVEYEIRQLFLDFDTSSLGSGATISNGVFTLYGTGVAETDTDGYDVQIRFKDWGGSVTTADYVSSPTNWNACTLMGHLAVGSWNQTNNTANNFTVDSYADVSKTGTTYVVVGMSGYTTTTPAPTGGNRIETYLADNTGTTSDPLLTVTYTPGSTAWTQTLTGTVTPGGTVAKKVTSTKTGTVTPAATLANKTAKALTATVTPAATVANKVAQAVAGAVTPAAVIVQKIAKYLDGLVTPVGALSTGGQQHTLDGSVAPDGTVTNKTAKALAATVTPAAVIVNAIRKALSGDLAPDGSATNVRTQRQSLDGSVTPTATVTNLARKTLDATVTPTATVSKFVAKAVSGTVTLAGTVSKKVAKSLSSSVTPTATLAIKTAKALAGTVTPAGALAYVHRQGSMIWAVARDIASIFGSARDVSSIEVRAYDLEAVTSEATDQESIAATAFDVERIIGEAQDG